MSAPAESLPSELSQAKKAFLSMSFDWERWPKLAAIFRERPRINVYWQELADFFASHTIAHLELGIALIAEERDLACDRLAKVTTILLDEVHANGDGARREWRTRVDAWLRVAP